MTSSLSSKSSAAVPAAALAVVACALLLGCGGGSGPGSAGAPVPGTTGSVNVAADGAVTAEGPVAAAPTPVASAAGTELPKTVSRLDCAP